MTNRAMSSSQFAECVCSGGARHGAIVDPERHNYSRLATGYDAFSRRLPAVTLRPPNLTGDPVNTAARRPLAALNVLPANQGGV
jgi:hypothetical protein